MKKPNEIIKDHTSYNKDENRVKNQIDFEKYDKKKSVFSFKKVAMLATSLCVLIIGGIVISDLSSGGTNSKVNKPSNNSTNTDNDIISHERKKIDNNALLGLASVKEFENAKVKKLGSYDYIEVDDNYNSVSSDYIDANDFETHYEYPFNFIKIHSAFKFQIEIPSDTVDEAVDVIRQNCGLGKLEVIVADFSTFLLDDDSDKNNNGIFNDAFADITDTMITIKGSEGLYTILTNSGHYDYVYDKDGVCHIVSSEIFSSHKTISDESIDKDFVVPYYGILLHKNPLGESSISFAKSDVSIVGDDDFKNKTKYIFDLEMIEEVSRNTIYNIHELTVLPQNTIMGNITYFDRDGKYLILEDVIEYGEYIIHIDNDTEFDEETILLDVLLNMLESAKMIEVTYDYLYDGYKPHNVYANSIVILSDN